MIDLDGMYKFEVLIGKEVRTYIGRYAYSSLPRQSELDQGRPSRIEDCYSVSLKYAYTTIDRLNDCEEPSLPRIEYIEPDKIYSHQILK